MSNVIWDAIRIRRENKPPPVSDAELEQLREMAEFQTFHDNAPPHWRRLVRAIEELQGFREEKKRGW